MLTTFPSRSTSVDASTSSSSAAMSNSCRLTSTAAARTAGDSVGTVLLPPLALANCVLPVSACSISMASGSTPNSSATTMAITVLVPVPMSLAPMFRFTLPSAKNLTVAVLGGPPPPAAQSPAATPTPRRTVPR